MCAFEQLAEHIVGLSLPDMNEQEVAKSIAGI